MKVKNIVFSGFAAAILMGTANAATTWSIASKAYVDREVNAVAGDVSTLQTTVNGLTTGDGSVATQIENVVGNLDGLSDSFGYNVETVVDAISDLKGDVNTLTGDANVSGSVAEAKAAADAAQSDVDALEGIVGDGFTSTNTVADAVNAKQDKLGGAGNGGKVVTSTDTAGVVTYTAVDSTIGATGTTNLITSAAVKNYVDTAINGVTGDAGSIADQIDSALGDLGDGNTTVADALADKADASDIGDVSGLTGFDTGTDTVVEALNELNSTKQDSLTTEQLAAVNSGVTSNKVTTYDSLAELLNGYAECARGATSGHCVLSADTNGMSWVDVTDPFQSGSSEPTPQ